MSQQNCEPKLVAGRIATGKTHAVIENVRAATGGCQDDDRAGGDAKDESASAVGHTENSESLYQTR